MVFGAFKYNVIKCIKWWEVTVLTAWLKVWRQLMFWIQDKWIFCSIMHNWKKNINLLFIQYVDKPLPLRISSFPVAINSIHLAFATSNYIFMKQYNKYNVQENFYFCNIVNKYCLRWFEFPMQ